MYKIVIDSCGELPQELKRDGHFSTVSLELEVDGYRIRDDESFNQLDFLRRVKESLKGPKSSCPSPEEYMNAYEGEAEHVYVVTLSGKLSGSYNSAVLGKNLYEEEHGDAKQIHVFNSKSASIGETIIGMKVQEFEDLPQVGADQQSQGARRQHTEYQAGDGFHRGRDDLPAWAGERHEESAGSDGTGGTGKDEGL
jgi:DegV family protein with EDD domain